MPNSRANKYCQYDRGQIPEIVKLINAKTISIKAASRTYNIPYSTLRDRVTGRIDMSANLGAPTILTPSEEEKLSNYLIQVAEMGVGKTREQVMEMAFMIIYRDPSRSRVAEKWLQNKTAGKDWYYLFMRRHKELSLRTPEKLSKARAKMTNSHVLNNFYDVIEPVITNDGCSRRPETIFNCDECGVPLDFRPRKVVAGKSTRSLWSLNSGDKTNITVLACGSASGQMMPPLVIYKGIRKNRWLVEGAPDGWFVEFSKSGWINSIIFEKWLENSFIPYVDKNVRSSQQEKVILLLDGHKSHETLYMLETAVKHNIEIICLPPNTTHVLQPLDVSFFKSLKARWDKVCQNYARSHHGSFINKANFSKNFVVAWDAVSANNEIIKNGFIRIGLSPFKRLSITDLLKDKTLSPADSLNRPLNSQQMALPTSEPLNSEQVTLPTSEPLNSQQMTLPTSEPLNSEQVTLSTSEPINSAQVTLPTYEPLHSQQVTLPTPEPFHSQQVILPTSEPLNSQQVTLQTYEPLNSQQVTLPTKPLLHISTSSQEGHIQVQGTANQVQRSELPQSQSSEDPSFQETQLQVEVEDAASLFQESQGESPLIISSKDDVSESDILNAGTIVPRDEQFLKSFFSSIAFGENIELEGIDGTNNESIMSIDNEASTSSLLNDSLPSLPTEVVDCVLQSSGDNNMPGPSTPSNPVKGLKIGSHVSLNLDRVEVEKSPTNDQCGQNEGPKSSLLSDFLPSLTTEVVDCVLQSPGGGPSCVSPKPSVSLDLDRMEVQEANTHEQCQRKKTETEYGSNSHLNDILVLPTIDLQPSKRKRKTNPYCRLLTSKQILGEKKTDAQKKNENALVKDQKKSRKSPESNLEGSKTKRKKNLKKTSQQQLSRTVTKQRKTKPTSGQSESKKMSKRVFKTAFEKHTNAKKKTKLDHQTK